MKNEINIRNQTGLLALMPAALVAAVLTFAAGPTARADDNAKVLPPNSHAFGKTYDEWSATWWQWALSVPADHNPLLDATGADAAQGQSGHVWFLAGTFDPTGTAKRSVTVPVGKALFFPVINNLWVSTLPTDPQDAAGIRAIIDPPADAETDLACEIDAVPVKNLRRFRTESPLFDVTLPDNNVFGIDAGTYGPSMDAGYYLLVAPLSPGHHRIHFHGALPLDIPPYWTAFAQDITYHLTVAPEECKGHDKEDR